MKKSKKIILVILALVIVIFSYSSGTEARFTSRAESAKNTFKAGTLKVELGDGDFKKDEKLQIKIIQPGKEYGEQKCLQVVNKGTLDFQYAVTATVNDNNRTGALKDKLMVQVRCKEKLDNNKNYNGESYVILYDGLVTSLKNDDIKGVLKSSSGNESIKNLYLYFYLPEYVNYNYQNKSANINISILANQITK